MSTGDYMTGWLRSELSGAACYGHPIEIVARNYGAPDGRRRLRICVETIDADTDADEVALTFDPRHSVEESSDGVTLDESLSMKRLIELEKALRSLEREMVDLRDRLCAIEAGADDGK